VGRRLARARRHRVLDVAAATIAALLAFTAVPAVLAFVVGDPLAGGLGHAWSPASRDVLCALVVVAWAAWVACCAQLVRAVIAQVRSGDMEILRGTSLLDRVAARIAVGVLALSSLGPLAVSSGAGATTTAPPGRVGTVLSRPQAPDPALRAAETTHAVESGDTLWSIAAERLDDGADWTAIAALNLGHTMAGGTCFVDPDQILPGWRLRLPLATGPREPRRPGVDRDTGRAPAGGHLPELVALGLGSLACAALARRARRRRADPVGFDLDLSGGRTVSEAAVDAASLLQRFAGIPALHSFETANCLLGRTLRDDPRRPAIRAICVSSSGVTFWLAEARRDAPDGFVVHLDGAAWHVDHGALREEDEFTPYVPLAFPVGDDDEGTWLVTLEPGAVLPVLGEAAPALLRSARVTAAAWAWSDMVHVTDDPGDPELRRPLTAVGEQAMRQNLYFGDPASLPPEVVRHTAVVTRVTVAASDLTVLVDHLGATLHPIGRVVRPHLQSEETAGALAELLAPPGARDRASCCADRMPSQAPGALGGTAAFSPGSVDVRLLTLTPRLQGLCEELPPNRARRAVELVAYLALHHPDGITGDRLRTRVLGSSDADAASKTLFNTAYAARRAMGVDHRGDPLFPAGTRNGLYQVSPQVTVDVLRAIALVAEGRSQTEPAVAVAHYRAALDLVEGEPLANALAGYTWWEAEGHGGRIAAALVDAACSMATLAADAGQFDLARWGLEQARLVEPYSEALSRAAMQLAAAEGDADRLRLEWRDCQRRVDALDPGSSPSTRTESLYGELSRRVLVGAGNAEPDRPGYAPRASD